jgi:uncharacterized membrane protein YccC
LPRRQGDRFIGGGTPRNPGADLARLPLGLDFSALSLAEGIRAALACAVVILANEWLGWPPLVYMALASFFTCLCDAGGPIRFRVPALLAFTLLGAATWMGFGLLRNAGELVAIPIACATMFLFSFARIWGTSATSVGNILSIVLILSLNQPLQPHQALEAGAMFVAGGLWATVLTMGIWRVHPYRPARNAVSECWRRLASLAEGLRELILAGVADSEAWDAHGRAHRRAVREEIEYARGLVMELAGKRGRLSLRGSQSLLRLEACDQVFGSLIALAGVVEGSQDTARLQAAETLLRLLRPMLTVLSRSMLDDTPLRLPALTRAGERALAATAQDLVLRRLAEAILDRLRIAALLSTPGGYLPGGGAGVAPSQPWRDRALAPLLSNLNWHSAILRHALRVPAVAAPALVLTLPYGQQFAYWLTITAVVTLQPFYATTWQRALERVGGTVLGGLIGALLAYLPSTPLQMAMLLFPLCAVAFAARQVSFVAWIAGITPIVVVLMELVHPGHSSWEVAELRALFTVAGGLLAVAGAWLLWPSWEPVRLGQEQCQAITAHAAYARAVMSDLLGQPSAGNFDAARRAAGVTTNNLETSISRALQEPGGSRSPAVAEATLVDATLRRIAGRLSALWYDTAARESLDPVHGEAWRLWLSHSLGALTTESGTIAPRPDLPPGDALANPLSRIARQIELLEGALRRGHATAVPAEAEGAAGANLGSR